MRWLPRNLVVLAIDRIHKLIETTLLLKLLIELLLSLHFLIILLIKSKGGLESTRLLWFWLILLKLLICFVLVWIHRLDDSSTDQTRLVMIGFLSLIAHITSSLTHYVLFSGTILVLILSIGRNLEGFIVVFIRTFFILKLTLHDCIQYNLSSFFSFLNDLLLLRLLFFHC